MNNYYPMMLGIMDLINDWNEKLNAFADKHLNNVGIGTLILGAVLVITILGINSLNKKN